MQTNTSPGTYRFTPAGSREFIVPPKFHVVWRGARGTNAPQYAVERTANQGTAVGWTYSLDDAQHLARLLNGGNACQVTR